MKTQNDKKQPYGFFARHGARIRSFGGEMLTFIGPGATIGVLIGLIAGIILSLLVNYGYIGMQSFERLRAQGGFAVFLFFVVLMGFFGGFAGTLVGIGTPKFNPHPQQGLKRENRPQPRS